MSTDIVIVISSLVETKHETSMVSMMAHCHSISVQAQPMHHRPAHAARLHHINSYLNHIISYVIIFNLSMD